MSDTPLPMGTESGVESAETSSGGSSFGKLARYTITRLATLAITVTIGIYLTILIANMGGYVDEIRRGAIREQVSIAVFQDQSAEMRSMSSEDKNKLIEEQVAIFEKQLGLDQPFIVRSFAFLTDALTLNLGYADTVKHR